MFHQVVSGSLVLTLTACGTAELRRSAPSRATEYDSAAVLLDTELVWRDVAESAGEQLVLLAGNPTRNCEYTLRRRFPTGHATLPHWHPHAEYGTVISGVFYIGFGDVASRSGATRLGPGGFIRVPPFTSHYSYADEEVILQVHGPGPRKTYYVHEVPVPRR
jgi:hypothetical protein